MMHSLRHAGMRLIVGASALAVIGVHAQQSQPSASALVVRCGCASSVFCCRDGNLPGR